MLWTQASSATLNTTAQQVAKHHQTQLTKPAGSLGELETVAIQLAAMQGTEKPRIVKPYITVFAGDHGIAAEGVSAYPQVVTGEMIRNFARGGAAISVLAKAHQAVLTVVNCGTITPIEPLQGVIDARIAAGTANFLHDSAMTHVQLTQALSIGQNIIERARAEGCDLFIAGEMGIANTTPATALACALLQRPATELVGSGTGITEATLAHKAAIIEQALHHHRAQLTNPMQLLQHIGGFEIAAITGAYIAAAQAGLPILVDGFISSAAALIAVKHNPSVRHWMLFAHTSAEPGHAAMMQALAAKPLLNLGMRLGEGSGAGVALSIVKLACELHGNMATFHDAGVSEKG